MTHTPPSQPTDDRLGRIVAQLDEAVARFRAAADANAAAVATFAAAVEELRPARVRFAAAAERDGSDERAWRQAQADDARWDEATGAVPSASEWLACGCHGSQREHACGPRETRDDEDEREVTA